MQTLRTSLLTLALLALTALTASAQQVQSGTSLFFDHPATDQEFVQTYQLCIDAAPSSPNLDALCQNIGVTRPDAAGVPVKFTMPDGVPRGRHDFTVRAVWKAPFTGASALSNALSLVVVGGPDRLRTTLQN